MIFAVFERRAGGERKDFALLRVVRTPDEIEAGRLRRLGLVLVKPPHVEPTETALDKFLRRNWGAGR